MISSGATSAANTDASSSAEVSPPQEEEVCSFCGGAGFVRRSVPLGHPDFGRAVPCRCVEEEREEQRLARLQRYSNLGPLTRLTFDNLIQRGRSARPSDQERFMRCVQDARAFAEEPEGWLVLHGASGCGKTHIAAAVANRCLELGTPALFVVVADLLDHMRATYRPGSEVGYDQLFEQVRNAPVLILDDLGTQSATPWAQEKLFQLINHRFNARLPTIVTTNVSLLQLDERLRARLTDPPLARVYQLEESRPVKYRELDLLQRPLLRDMTFESFDIRGYGLNPEERRSLENAHRQALAFAEQPENWLLFMGRHGCGKTHLAAAIANYRQQRGEPPCFVVVPELLDFLRQGFSEENPVSYHEVFEYLRTAPLLILDDLDTQTDILWVREKLFQLLNYRYTSCLPTVITTAARLEDLGDRIASRLVDPAVCSVLPIRAPGYRAEVGGGEHKPEQRKRGRPRR